MTILKEKFCISNVYVLARHPLFNYLEQWLDEMPWIPL